MLVGDITAAPGGPPSEATADGIPVHYVQHGPARPSWRCTAWTSTTARSWAPWSRCSPTGPGTGAATRTCPAWAAPEPIDSTDAVLDTLLGLVDAVIGETAFLVVGHSYGGYLARAIANRRPGQVAGLAVLCSLLGAEGGEDERPEPVVLYAADDLDLDATLEPAMAAEFRDYLVVQTPATLRRFRQTVVPGTTLADKAALERIFQRWRLRAAPEQAPAYANPTLILAGRQDATVGYAGSWRLLEHHPRATFAVLDRAGHALPHEQVGLLTALMGEWLDRVRERHSAQC
jgi:pimeloyl-ACP methyl ester carboxylesterase